MQQTKNGRRRAAVTIIAAAIAIPGVMPATTVLAEDAPAIVGVSVGEEGESVRAIQQALIDQNISLPGGVDGVFGAGTEAAVKRLQAQHGLKQTGAVDRATAIALGVEESLVYGLAEGDRGDRVRALQQALVDLGFDVGSAGVDGVFGQATADAVEDFQRSKSFLPTGKVNAATAAALGDVSVPTAAVEPAEAASTAERAGASDEGGESATSAADSGGAGEIEGLAIGARGDAVKRVQQALMDAGFTVTGGADGYYGALTASAVQSFQSVNGLDVTGEIDAATADAIRAIGSTPDDHDDDHDPTVSAPLVGLKYGALGSDVVSLQQALIAAGHRPAGGADGIFGPATRAALEEFQAAQGLEATGQVDAATAAALNAGSGASSSMIGLRAGSLGEVVVRLQTALDQAGFRPRGGADGIFGPATAQALKDFQANEGLDTTGVVDEATASALDDPKPAPAAAKAGPVESADGFAVFGEKGPRVVALQTALVEAGLEFRGGVDGSFGGGTSGAVMEFQRQNGLSVTGRIDTATADALGLEPSSAPEAPDASSVKLEVFPMQGPCQFSDTWMYPRGGGRVHLGVDIIGAEGLLLYAVADGTITKVYSDGPGSLSGNGVRIEQPDGTYFFYAHMVSVAEGIEVGTKVKAGQVVGYNGSTGSSGTPHLHLEIHPQGGSAINPYPVVKAIDACDVTDPLPQP